jgi:hypothetical protein
MHVIHQVRHFFVALILASFLIYTPLAEASASSKVTRTAVQQQIEMLLAQVNVLQKQLRALEVHGKKASPASFAYKTTFYTGKFESLYEVNGTALIPQDGRSVQTGDQLVWNTFVNIVGSSINDADISEFRIYNDAHSEVSAFVEEKPDHTWILAINREGQQLSEIYNKKTIIDLLLHEYGHIIFFTQAESVEKDFSSTFWNGKSKPQTYKESDFVTQYAATSPTEDMIESFVQFVAKDKPLGALTQFEKVRFFYQYPELLTLRTQLRKSDLF